MHCFSTCVLGHIQHPILVDCKPVFHISLGFRSSDTTLDKVANDDNHAVSSFSTSSDTSDIRQPQERQRNDRRQRLPKREKERKWFNSKCLMVVMSLLSYILLECRMSYVSSMHPESRHTATATYPTYPTISDRPALRVGVFCSVQN